MSITWCFTGADCSKFAQGAACLVSDILSYPEYEDQNDAERDWSDRLSYYEIPVRTG